MLLWFNVRGWRFRSPSTLHKVYVAYGWVVYRRKGSTRARPNVPLWEQTRSQRRRNEYSLVVEYIRNDTFCLPLFEFNSTHDYVPNNNVWRRNIIKRARAENEKGYLGRNHRIEFRFLSAANRYSGFFDLFLPPAPSECNEIGLNPHSYKKRNRRRRICNFLSFSIAFAVH